MLYTARYIDANNKDKPEGQNKKCLITINNCKAML